MTDEPVHASFQTIDLLLSRGHQFSFSQIMRIARRHFGPGGPEELPGVDWQDRVHVRPDLSLAFPAADVVRVERTGEDGADLLVTTTFLGLYGASSPLPTHYTEELMDEAAADSSVSRDFLDIIHQRHHQLYFACWGKYRLCIRLAEEASASDLERLLCLIGLGERELQESAPDARSLLRYAGLCNQPRSAEGLETLLRDTLGVTELEVEECVPRRAPIPGDQRTRLGVANNRLGVDTILGSELPDDTGKFRIHIGPVSKAEFDSFLPGSPRHDRLARLVRYYLVDPFDYDLKLTMAAGEARPIRLGDPEGPRLGLNSWCFSGATRGEVSAIFPIARSKVMPPSPAADPTFLVPDRSEPATLTDYYRQELACLRELAGRFAKAHPELAPMVSGQAADPSVERLFEGVAFLNAHLQMKINDDFPEIIHEWTKALHPWDLRPIPATTVVAFSPKTELVQSLRIGAGAEVGSIPVQGTKCRFKTCSDVTLHPLKLLGATCLHPPGEYSRIGLKCALNAMSLADWRPGTLRLFLGDDHPAALDLYLLLTRYLQRIVITALDGGAAVECARECLQPVGFSEAEIILGKEPGVLAGHLILQEYFLFKDKFLFLDLCGLEACQTLGHGCRFEIRFELSSNHPKVPRVTERSFVLFATPAINLFPYKAGPVTFTNGATRQKVRPAGNDAGHYQIHTVDRITDFGNDLAEAKSYTAPKPPFPYRNDTVHCRITHDTSPLVDGSDTFICVETGSGGPPTRPPKLNIDLTCSNGTLPEGLKVGDICTPTPASCDFARFRNIKPVTPTIQPAFGRNLQWRLFSGLSLNRSLLEVAADLRAVLRLFLAANNRDRAAVQADKERIDAITAIEATPTDRLIGCRMYRGYEIRIKLCGDRFSGPGDLYLFCCVLERFFGGYVTEICFIRLLVEETGTGQRYQWPARLGDRPLL